MSFRVWNVSAIPAFVASGYLVNTRSDCVWFINMRTRAGSVDRYEIVESGSFPKGVILTNEEARRFLYPRAR